MSDEFRLLIERGDLDAVKRALQADASLANRTVRWHLNQDNESDPLHYVSDCVGHGWLADDKAAQIAGVLLSHGAEIGGTQGREAPLIAAASLGADLVANVLLEAGADLESIGVFGARALHWAAWTGASGTVQRLLARGARMEDRCTEFGATPLFWAVHGFGPRGAEPRKDQLGAARALIAAGAIIDTRNKHGESAIDMARGFPVQAMYELLTLSRR